MKLILATAASLALGALAETQMLKAHAAQSDECVGCEVAPPSKYGEGDPSKCGRDMPKLIGVEPKKDGSFAVQCDMEEGYYPDPDDCSAFCFCSGHWDQYSGTPVPSKYAKCPEGQIWNKDCRKYHPQLSSGGYAGGCCDHPRNVPDLDHCPVKDLTEIACTHLTKFHCQLDMFNKYCGWNDNCNCCMGKE